MQSTKETKWGVWELCNVSTLALPIQHFSLHTLETYWSVWEKMSGRIYIFEVCVNVSAFAFKWMLIVAMRICRVVWCCFLILCFLHPRHVVKFSVSFRRNSRLSWKDERTSINYRKTMRESRKLNEIMSFPSKETSDENRCHKKWKVQRLNQWFSTFFLVAASEYKVFKQVFV